MKHFKSLIFLFLFILIASDIAAQSALTLTQENFIVDPNEGYFSKAFTPNNMLPPEEGGFTLYDYRNLDTLPYNWGWQYYPASNPAFPNAIRYKETELAFGPFDLERNYYEEINGTGFYEVGSSMLAQNISLLPFTGNPNDVLAFPAQNDVLPTPRIKMTFPCTFGSSWQDETYYNTIFNLTVTAFGLNNIPGNHKQIVTENSEVLGWGMAMIPKNNGTSIPYKVLYVRHIETSVDSFFLGGAPMPANLLAAFGLQQGSSKTYYSYKLYRENSSLELFRLSAENQPNNLIYGYYSDESDIEQSITGDFLYPLNPETYPMPVTATTYWKACNTTTTPVPAPGFNQLWDYYPADTLNGYIWNKFVEPSAPAVFPTAFRAMRGLSIVGPFSLYRDFHQYYDETGLYDLGVYTPRYSFPLSSVTGNPNDSLIFPLQNDVFDEPKLRTAFNFNSGLDWESNVRYVTNFNITVQAYGFNNVPGQQVQLTKDTFRIIGCGAAIIPLGLGSTIPYNSMLIERKIITIDSFYLAGNPMPAALLGAFGLAQGTVSVHYNYEIFREGSSHSLIYAAADNSGITMIGYAIDNTLSNNAPTVLVSPEDNDEGIPLAPEFTWLPNANEPSSYNLQISTNTNFSDIVFEHTKILNTNFTLGEILNIGNQYFWRVSANYGALQGPWSEVWNFTTIAPVEINLNTGWNLISSNAMPQNPNIIDMFAQVNNLALVKAANGTIYDPTYNINTIGYWDIKDAYWVYLTAPSTLEFLGAPVKPENTPIMLKQGWNMVSYLRNSSMAPADALQSIDGSLIFVKDAFGNIYYPAFGLNTLTNLNPKEGYWIYMTSPAVLIYPNN